MVTDHREMPSVCDVYKYAEYSNGVDVDGTVMEISVNQVSRQLSREGTSHNENAHHGHPNGHIYRVRAVQVVAAIDSSRFINMFLGEPAVARDPH